MTDLLEVCKRPVLHKKVFAGSFRKSCNPYPSLSAGAFMATISMATLARYRFVPSPALAVISVFFKTSLILVRVMMGAGGPDLAVASLYK